MIQYIGIPYDVRNQNGLNCWGLVALVYHDVFKKTVADYKVESNKDIIKAFNDAFVNDTHGFKQVDEPKDYDVIILKKGKQHHCGLMYNCKILHASNKTKQVVYQKLSDVKRDYESVTFWRQ